MVADHQHDVGLLAGAHHGQAFVDVPRHGFFYQHMFARARRVEGLRCVQRVGRGDQDGVDGGVVEDGVHVLSGGYGMALCDFGGLVAAGDDGEVRVRTVADGFSVGAAGEAGADDGTTNPRCRNCHRPPPRTMTGKTSSTTLLRTP